MAGHPSRSRRLAREAAFQALYMVHVGRASVEGAVETIKTRQTFEGEAVDFLFFTVEGVREREEELDDIIRSFLAKNWTLERIAVSDLIALRIGVFELYHRPGTPPKVSITEAVELAKRFGAKESGSFVNGVLASVLKQSPKANWDDSMEEKPEPVDRSEPQHMPDDLNEDEALEAEESSGTQAGAWTIRSGE